MKKYNIAILGATGAVGKEMLRGLAERDFPFNNLHLLAGKSAGTTLYTADRAFVVQRADTFDFTGIDIVLGAADNATATALADKITDAGAVFIDNSSAFRHKGDVPLVVPEINACKALEHHGIIANPNCSTIIALMGIWPIVQDYGLRGIVASTYQAVSGAGEAGLSQLEQELAGMPVNNPAFIYPIARNVIPAIGSEGEDGYTSEEVKMQSEGRKILDLPDIAVSCTCVRVPVTRCHSISLNIRTEKPISLVQAKQTLQNSRGVIYIDDDYPMPINAQGQDNVLVGRLRRDETAENGLCLWCCGDQLRKGAAVNALQIAEVIAGIF